ncbi:MAG TPA: hypothetical protein VGK49_12780, partial [Ilumatobacteraceae bacterium]
MTVSTNVSLAAAVPSLTVTVIVAVPLALATGVTDTVRLAPLPPKAIPLLATMLESDDVPLSVKLPG